MIWPVIMDPSIKYLSKLRWAEGSLKSSPPGLEKTKSAIIRQLWCSDAPGRRGIARSVGWVCHCPVKKTRGSFMLSAVFFRFSSRFLIIWSVAVYGRSLSYSSIWDVFQELLQSKCSSHIDPSDVGRKEIIKKGTDNPSISPSSMKRSL